MNCQKKKNKRKLQLANFFKFCLGITSKLKHVKEIGAGAVWLSPIFQSPMYDFGYDISDFYAIHDEYGTMEDFEALVAKADELGKKLKITYQVNKDFMPVVR